IVSDEFNAKATKKLGNERTNATEADNSYRLLVQLSSGERGTLPLPRAQRAVGALEMTGEPKNVRHSELCGTDDVRGRRIDDHDPSLGGCFDVDVVKADASTGDHL